MPIKHFPTLILSISLPVLLFSYFFSPILKSEFATGWRPASFAMQPSINETLALRPMQRLSPSATLLSHLVNTSSFSISDKLAGVARFQPQNSKPYFTLTQWDRPEQYTTQDDSYDCQLSRCRIVTDKKIPNDGYIFNLRGGNPWEPIPDLRNKFSILLMTESPINTFGFAKQQVDLPFDVSLTYRSDSDALFIYGMARLRSEPLESIPDFSLGRRRGAYWAVSNWSGRRFSVYRSLSSKISIDIFGSLSWMSANFFGSDICVQENNYYGDCVNDKKVREVDNCKRAEAEYKSCMGKVAKDYWFYLAFENSECDQYVTEKPWNAISLGNVPVVLGGTSPADYAEVLPPRSFIHVDDFESTEALGEYLQYLMENPEAYNEYHEWRKYYEPFVPSLHGDYSRWCHMCDVLAQKKPGESKKTMGEWWFAENTCKPIQITRNF